MKNIFSNFFFCRWILNAITKICGGDKLKTKKIMHFHSPILHSLPGTDSHCADGWSGQFFETLLGRFDGPSQIALQILRMVLWLFFVDLSGGCFWSGGVVASRSRVNVNETNPISSRISVSDNVFFDSYLFSSCTLYVLRFVSMCVWGTGRNPGLQSRGLQLVSPYSKSCSKLTRESAFKIYMRVLQSFQKSPIKVENIFFGHS
jgi:hypothetical protein